MVAKSLDFAEIIQPFVLVNTNLRPAVPGAITKHLEKCENFPQGQRSRSNVTET